MSWFESLFKKAILEEEEAIVPADKLVDWFLEHTDPLLTDMKSDVQEAFDTVQERIQDTKDAIRLLGEAVLLNPDIPDKAKNVMEGNRQSYIKAITNFLGSITFPDEITSDSTSSFVSDYEERFQTLQKMTQRNYYVLQEFFKDEAEEVLDALRELDEAVRSIISNDFRRITDLKKQVSMIEKYRKAKDKVADDILQEEQALNVTEKLIAAANSTIRHLKTTPFYFELEKLQKQREVFTARIKSQESKLSMFFMQMERPLRKYVYFIPADKQIVEDYLTTPLQALQQDNGLRIALILKNVEQLIKDGHIELKEKEAEKLLLKFQEMDDGALRNILRGYHDSKEGLQQVERNIRLNTIQQQLEEADYKLDHMEEKARKIRVNIDRLNLQEGKYVDAEFIKNLEKGILDVLGKAITISLDDKAGRENNSNDDD
ncbi:hypothetical protein HYU19_02115 [Candidatus Woesearchaeota archaeon]|nr:hypothetical protein [Candidatus Woesearchaeota archaeon]